MAHYLKTLLFTVVSFPFSLFCFPLSGGVYKVDWSSIEAIAGKSLDLWILLPSGVIINRLLEKDGSLKHHENLERFFGMDKQAIKDWFYQPHSQLDLWGDPQEWYEKRVRQLYLTDISHILIEPVSYFANFLFLHNSVQLINNQ